MEAIPKLAVVMIIWEVAKYSDKYHEFTQTWQLIKILYLVGLMEVTYLHSS
jgi:hypothetical protein